jgi:hypothetical protein
MKEVNYRSHVVTDQIYKNPQDRLSAEAGNTFTHAHTHTHVHTRVVILYTSHNGDCHRIQYKRSILPVSGFRTFAAVVDQIVVFFWICCKN